MRGRIALLAALLSPVAAFAAPAAKTPGRALRSGGFVYLKMPRALVAAVRAPGWGEDAPDAAATAGALTISPLRSLIRSPFNILTAVDAEGQTREVAAGEKEVLLLQELGAKPVGDGGGYALKRFLRLELKNPPKTLTIQAGESSFDFSVEAAP